MAVTRLCLTSTRLSCKDAAMKALQITVSRSLDSCKSTSGSCEIREELRLLRGIAVSLGVFCTK